MKPVKGVGQYVEVNGWGLLRDNRASGRRELGVVTIAKSIEAGRHVILLIYGLKMCSEYPE